MSATQLELSSKVSLFPLHVGDEVDGESEVGRADTGEFIGLPAEGVALIRWLDEGLPLTEVSDRFTSRFGVATDVAEFVRDLADCGFVRAIDGRPVIEQADSGTPEPQQAGWRLLGGLPSGAVSWLLSWPAMLLYAAIWLTLPVALILAPQMRPDLERAFLGIGAVGNLAVITLCGWTLALLHELAHLVIVRARGCMATLDISHRFHLLVAQTDMSSVRVLPRRQRYAPYLAGMTLDATWVLAAMALANLTGWEGFATVGYVAAIMLAFQFAVFLRTDLYYAFTNAFRVGNLKQDTQRWLINLATRLARLPARHDLTGVSRREMRVIRAYAPLAVAGVAVLLGSFFLLGLPLLLEFLQAAAAGFQAGPASIRFWDSLGLVSIAALQFGLLFFAMYRERRRRRSRATRATEARAAVG